MATFDPYMRADVTRSVPSDVTRGAALFRSLPTEDNSHTKDDAWVDDAVEDVVPALPYPSEFCSPNTFASSGTNCAPEKLQDLIIAALAKTKEVDILSQSRWDFTSVFYPDQVRTIFKTSIFKNNAGAKNDCLVEMQLQEGDRCAFQNLCTYVRSNTKLAHAFADEWGYDTESDEEDIEEEYSYSHRTFAPLPLPTSLSPEDTETDDDLSPTGSDNVVLDVLVANIHSAFADVRRNSWQELANNKRLAEEMVTRANGLELATSALDQCDAAKNDSVSCDTQRCVMKTVLNSAECDGFEKVHSFVGLDHLKKHIVQLSKKNNSLETRSIAVSLMQSLLKKSKDQDDLISALKESKRDTNQLRLLKYAGTWK